MKHKICYILPEYKEDASTHFSYIAPLLREAGKELDIFLIIEKGEKPLVPEALGCVKVISLKAPGAFTRAVKLKLWLLYARAKGYRDFYVHYSFIAAFIASCIARLSGGRVFYWNCGEWWKFHRSFLRGKFERAVYHLVTHLVTGADSLALEYADRCGIAREKIRVMPNWIDPDRFGEFSDADKNSLRRELGLPEGKKIVLFVHWLSARKGSKMILPVLGELLLLRNDAFFVVAGRGPDEKELRARTEKVPNFRDAIRFLGAVPNRDIQKYFAAADAFFMPSQEEGFPRALLESMAAGVPAVASDVGAVREILPESMTSYVIAPNDVQGFARALDLVLSKKPEETAATRSVLRAKAAEYDTALVAKKFVSLFA